MSIRECTARLAGKLEDEHVAFAPVAEYEWFVYSTWINRQIIIERGVLHLPWSETRH